MEQRSPRYEPWNSLVFMTAAGAGGKEAEKTKGPVNKIGGEEGEYSAWKSWKPRKDVSRRKE